MLRSLSTLCIIALCLVVPSIEITKPFTGITLNRAVSSEKPSYTSSLQNQDLLESMVIVPHEVSKKQELGNMLSTIDQIDRPLLQYLKDNGIMIRLFNGALTDEPLLYPLKWQHPRGWEQKVTWEEVPGSGGGWLISAKIGASEPGNGHSSLNLELHEIGHTVYNQLSPAQKLKFTDIWKKEVSMMFPENKYFSSYVSEYYSEAFAHYYFNTRSVELLKERAPSTYQFFTVFQQPSAGF